MPLPEAPLIRDAEPLYAKLYAHVTDDPAQSSAFMAVVGILSMVKEEAAIAQDILRKYEDRPQEAPGREISIGLCLGKIEMANRTIRAVAEGLRHLPEPSITESDNG